MALGHAQNSLSLLDKTKVADDFENDDNDSELT